MPRIYTIAGLALSSWMLLIGLFYAVFQPALAADALRLINCVLVSCV